MALDRSSTPVDWKPYRATGIMLVVALGLNAWTGNGLWFWYTAIGLGGLLTFVGLARADRLVFPNLAVWMLGVGGAMHYIGGSLSGLHTIGGPNGLYYVFPWWDNLVHALGSGAMAVAAAALLQRHLNGSLRLLVFLAACVACTVGVLVELWEFSQFLLLGTIDQGFYTNTLLDLWNNLLGSALGAFVYVRLSSLTPRPDGASHQAPA